MTTSTPSPQKRKKNVLLQIKQLVFMIRVHVLLNMFLNFISSEMILPTYFEIQGFERHCGLT